MEDIRFLPAHQISELVKSQKLSAREVVDFFLEKISEVNPKVNAYTEVLTHRARKTADAVDLRIKHGETLGPLAGVPFAVKNLYDIDGITTLAGSKINADHTAAKKDAELIKRMESAGAILIGAVTMGEYAYDFTGENQHYGACRNPWDTARMTGGSSSGSGSATAAGIAPISLGSDTNGSIRVPASLCGIFGLKPTYGRLPRTGSFPFCDSLDHLGPLARTVQDLAIAFDALQGFDKHDHACQNQPVLATQKALSQGIDDLRINVASGYFKCSDFPQAQNAINKVASALNAVESTEIEGALEGRSAAYLITNVEGSRFHLPRLQERVEDFDADTRDRFIAGTMIPASWYARAQQVRHWYLQNALKVFESVDLLIAPATPVTAPKIGQKMLKINGEEVLLRPNMGYYTQPISAIGLPSVTIPTIDNQTGLPIGVQLIAAPWREDLCLRAAAFLEENGFEAKQPMGI